VCTQEVQLTAKKGEELYSYEVNYSFHSTYRM
jgi:hypothetical protein